MVSNACILITWLCGTNPLTIHHTIPFQLEKVIDGSRQENTETSKFASVLEWIL